MDEFVAALPLIESWVGHLPNPEAEFRTIDTNGDWAIEFDEFCDWSIKKNIDIEELNNDIDS